jgi:AcrR family transcriptional regulator
MVIQDRKERERERRRQQIIVAARRVFAAKGLSKATMEDIANEAELSPGTLYIYFGNKDELYASLAIRILKHLNIRLKHVTDRKDLNHDGRIFALEKALYDVYEFDPLVLINIFHLQSSETLKNLSSELLAEITSLSKQSLKAIAEIFKSGIEESVFIKNKPIVYADIVWALFSGLILLEESKRILNERKDYLKPTLEIAFKILSLGIRKTGRD